MSLPALLGGVPVADAETYPSWPQWGDREREELLATLDSGAWWTGDGERAYRFAREFAHFQGAAERPARSRTARRRSRRRSWPAVSARATR